MATRPVISYDDITLPYDQPEEQKKSTSSYAAPPPSKKRRKNNQKAKRWDDPSRANFQKSASNSQHAEFNKYISGSGSTQKQGPQLQYPEEEEEDAEEEVKEGEYEEDESRELTHEEIWDDSALVNAWESAMEEYRAYHGPGKDWKKEPVKKSPLWYNIPIDPSSKAAALQSAEADSQPINFDTFVPTHDASLDQSSNPVPTANYIPDTPTGLMVSQDEAFSRALSAMYWGGYWTAMYHAQRQLAQANPSGVSAPTDDAEEEDLEEGEDIEVDNDDSFLHKGNQIMQCRKGKRPVQTRV
ncbi:hypothetical protein BDZ97DRAFT_1921656 [Flammula alnicola]|nr:hypothetical protein BDZ97DRAFT_1921656 [Flammula alnicola]